MELPEENRQVNNPLQAMQPGETIVCSIKRHPIGLINVYIMAGLLVLIIAVLAFLVAPHYITTVSRTKVEEVGGLIFVVVAIASAAFVLISSRIYWGNSWVVTSDSITQITQTGLFDRQSSQLSLGNLEDVTAVQNGLLTHIFNYGVLRVETAGERSKFVFTWCPHPNTYAQQVLDAREKFEQGRRGQDLQRPYRAESAYAEAGQPQPTPSESTQPSEYAQPTEYAQPPIPPTQPPAPKTQPPAGPTPEVSGNDGTSTEQPN